MMKMIRVELDYLEDIFENEYLPDDGSDYKAELYSDRTPSVFEGENIILPDWSKR
jgi:hypothetical protein